eukprot:UN27209
MTVLYLEKQKDFWFTANLTWIRLSALSTQSGSPDINLRFASSESIAMVPIRIFWRLFLLKMISILAIERTRVTRHVKAEVNNFGDHRDSLWYPNNPLK